uniref:G-protein coupled receptors family 2 profile 2 domain-containing protein n=1 Tax=Amphimedon queenslandica TaxID=400682 RepID=A0A1X7VNE1_AMPQE
MSGLLSCSLTNASVLCSGKLIPYHSQASQPVFGTLHNCSEPCNGAFFSQEQVDILHYSNLVLSCLSIITGCIILFLYLINYCKIKHPEAPIYYIAGLQLVISTMQLISGLYGTFNSMSSTNSSSDSEGLHCDDRYKNHFNESILLQDGGDNPFCLTIFAILYYSFLSILSWWTVITIEWLVTSIKRKITKKKYLYIISHIAGWSIPIPFLFTAAYLNAVSGSTTEMTCWISRRNESLYQLAFIITPLSDSGLIARKGDIVTAYISLQGMKKSPYLS